MAQRAGGIGAGRHAALAAGLALALLSGCAGDGGGLRDWSLQARESVLPAVAAASHPAPAGRADAVAALQEAAGAWLAVLAALAEDAPPPDDSAAIAARAPRIAPFDAEGAAAVLALAQGVGYVAGRGWGAASIAHALRVGDPLFQPVMAALARQAAALEAEAPPATTRDAARREAAARIAAMHARLAARGSRVHVADTGRELRLEASELRRLGAAR